MKAVAKIPGRHRGARRAASAKAAVALLGLPARNVKSAGKVATTKAVEDPDAATEAAAARRTVAFTYSDVSSIKFTLTSALSDFATLLFAGESFPLDPCTAPPSPPRLSPPPAPKVTVHGDPMFKKNGVGLQFSLPLGRPHELLAWVNKAGEKVVLTGTTFEVPDNGHQWFDSFAMSVGGKEVFNASNAKVARGSLRVVIDGNLVIPADIERLTSAVHSGTSFELSMMSLKDKKKFMIGHKSAQMLQVRTGDVTFSVYSSKAGKFASKDDQFNFRHLNVRLDTGIPEHAGGIFAEMAGAETMSTATREMLHKPRLFDRLMRLEKKEAQRAARRSHLAAHRDGDGAVVGI